MRALGQVWTQVRECTLSVILVFLYRLIAINISST